MRAVLQRVNHASVTVENKVVGEIGRGFVVFLGVGKGDTKEDTDYLVHKICGLRIFEDENEKMILSPKDVGADMLVISNFTLYASTIHGFRPDSIASMPYTEAQEFVEDLIAKCKREGTFRNIASGVFGADMRVDVSVDGPINIIFNTEETRK